MLQTPTKTPRHIIHSLERKRGHCRRCGILIAKRGAQLFCDDCSARAPLISYQNMMGDDRFFIRVRADFQLAGDDNARSRYVCVECLGAKGYHGKICRSCASKNNRGNARLAAPELAQ